MPMGDKQAREASPCGVPFITNLHKRQMHRQKAGQWLLGAGNGQGSDSPWGRDLLRAHENVLGAAAAGGLVNTLHASDLFLFGTTVAFPLWEQHVRSETRTEAPTHRLPEDISARPTRTGNSTRPRLAGVWTHVSHARNSVRALLCLETAVGGGRPQGGENKEVSRAPFAARSDCPTCTGSRDPDRTHLDLVITTRVLLPPFICPGTVAGRSSGDRGLGKHPRSCAQVVKRADPLTAAEKRGKQTCTHGAGRGAQTITLDT